MFSGSRPLAGGSSLAAAIAAFVSFSAHSAAPSAVNGAACAALSADHVLHVERWPEGGPRVERCLLDGVPDGPYREASASGATLAEGSYRRGTREGAWRRWYPRGGPESSGTFAADKETGQWRFWHPSGAVRAEGAFRCGARVGQWRYFTAEGKESRRAHAHAAEACGAAGSVRWRVALGYSSILYRETGHADLNMTALTAKAAYHVPAVFPGWEGSLSAYLTALPLARSREEVTARFLGLNARMGWGVPSVGAPWRLTLSGGVYYTTMIVGGPEPLGFNNLWGPQAFAALRRETGEDAALSAYLKYSLMMNGFEIFALSNREVGGGIAYEFGLGDVHPLTVSLDLANLRLDFEGSHVSSSSVTLGLGYGF